MSSSAVSGVNDVSGVIDLVENWTTTPSDPLLSEHTLLKIDKREAWVATVGEPVTALLTLVPTKLSDIGLVEVASLDMSARIRLWNETRDDLVSEARRRGFKGLEIIDRSQALADPESVVTRSVVRMNHRGPVTPENRHGVENATVGDIRGILDLLQEAFSGHPENGDWSMADITQRMAQDWYDPLGLFVIRQGSSVEGLCWTKVHPDSVGEIYLVAVSAGLTGHGVGRALVEHGVRYLKTQKGCAEVIVYSESANSSALALYEGVGFKVDRIDSRLLLKL